MSLEYHIETFPEHSLIVAKLRGCLDKSNLVALDRDFWAAWLPDTTRVLFDYQDIVSLDMSIADTLAVGNTDREHRQPQEGLRAAYVVGNEITLGLCRVIQSVWSTHLAIEVFSEPTAALEWLDLPADTLDPTLD
ncbi:MAG: hypothetical protein O6766_12935 [Gammaproteobacteria bacterium]|nr:hypothetical protein [Gammaproteobacteria bacterium]